MNQGSQSGQIGDDRSIFSFDHYADYLNAARYGLAHATSSNKFRQMGRKLTLKEWADRLGYRSPRLIAMVLKKQRIPSYEMTKRLHQDLNHSPSEAVYFEELINKARADRKGMAISNSSHLSKVQEETTKEKTTFIDKMKFAHISQWYYLVIKQLFRSENSQNNPKWVYQKLGKKIGIDLIVQAIQRMEDIGLLKRNPYTGKIIPCDEGLHTAEDIPADCVREHHLQMLDRAKEAIFEQSTKNREATSLTLCFDKNADLEAAKKDIRNFRTFFNNKYFKAKSDDIYQLNIQFFSHTKSQNH